MNTYAIFLSIQILTLKVYSGNNESRILSIQLYKNIPRHYRHYFWVFLWELFLELERNSNQYPQEYVYEYFYKEPESYYDDTILKENVTETVPVNKYTSIWQHDDASWIFSDVFMVLSIQTGFALLESGCASLKNEANIMMKNAIDVLMGGFSYWMFGFGLSYGEGTLRLELEFNHSYHN